MFALVRFGILGIVSAPFVVLLKRAGFPGGWSGASIGAGLLVGLLAGPVGLGRTAPDWWRRSPGPDPGAAHALAAREALDGAEVEALRATGVSAEGVVEHAALLRARRQPLIDAAEESARARLLGVRQGEAGAIVLLAGSTILGASCAGAPRGRGARRARGHAFGTGAMIAAFSLAFGAAGNALVMTLVLKVEPVRALALGAGLAGGSAWFALPGEGAGLSGARVWAQAWMALVFAGGAAWISAAPGADVTWLGPGLGACAATALAWRLLGPDLRVRRAIRRAMWPAVHGVVVPALGAYVAFVIEPAALMRARAPGFILAWVGFVGCGYLLGTWLGVSVVRPRGARAWGVWLAALLQGTPASLVLASAAMLASGAIDPGEPTGQALLAGGLLGALACAACAACAPLLRRMTVTEAVRRP